MKQQDYIQGRKAALGIGVLNRNPLLIHIIWAIGRPFGDFIDHVSQELGSTPALILVTNYWSIISRWKNDLLFQEFCDDYRSHRQRYSHHQVVLIANDALEKKFIEVHGIDTVLFQHNGFLHARQESSVAKKEFDAIYLARIERHKRLELAKEVPSCCIVFASVNGKYYSEIRSQISHFTFANGDPASTAGDDPFFSKTPLLSKGEVADWCARSRTGLILSAEEGANWASGEYMLWGLPVVSTRSLGGRDYYFDERYWTVCEADPASVAEAVKEVISRNIDPGLIRNTFLSKVIAARIEFLNFIILRTKEWGGSLEPFIRDWINIDTPFADRIRVFSADDLLEEVECRRSKAIPDESISSVNITSLSGKELRQLRNKTTQEMRRRGILPAKEGQQGSAESGTGGASGPL